MARRRGRDGPERMTRLLMVDREVGKEGIKGGCGLRARLESGLKGKRIRWGRKWLVLVLRRCSRE
jgi:hypothetical protein